MTTELTNAAQAALNACERIVGQEGSVQFGIDFHALGSSLRRALAHRPAAQDDSDEAQVADYQEALASVDALVRRLDVALNGDAAASQARLCDIVSQVERQGLRPAAQEVDWRELTRRLYVELFYCDQQMTSTRDEDGEPRWETGSTVRDVLRDAKATLEALPAPQQSTPIEPSGLHYSMDKQATPSTIEHRLRTILNGIDKDETEDEAGWWETSDGAALGDRKLAEVLDAVRQATPEPVCLGALMELTAERNKLQAALEIACSHLTDEQAAQVAAAMPDTVATPEPVQGLIDALDWISDNGPDDAYELRQHARDALEAFRTATPELVGEPYAYAVYFPDQPTEVLVHDLDELTDDLTNRQHAITKLYTRPAAAPAVPMLARSLSEWHEEDGTVMWWAWNGETRGWAGEAAYIGSPLCDDWPGYHTHWTPHPPQPALASAQAKGAAHG